MEALRGARRGETTMRKSDHLALWDYDDCTVSGRCTEAAAIRLDRGILFTTYATLRPDACREKVSLVRQIVDWAGAGFGAVIVFDESDAMQNAAGEKSERGDSSNLNAAVQAANVTDKAAA
jgi:hypothetical protein